MRALKREYEVELNYPDGSQRFVHVGTELGIAQSLAASPANWDPPGPAGVIRYRDVVTITGAWTPLNELPATEATPTTCS